MGLLSLLIVSVLIALFFVYSYFSGLPDSFTPKDSQKIQTEGQSAVDATLEKSKLEQEQAKKLMEQ